MYLLESLYINLYLIEQINVLNGIIIYSEVVKIIIYNF